MTSVANASPSVDDIRRSMAQIRQKLHQDMQGVVAGAEAAADWKHYVKMYPLAALGMACAAGYLIVPRKRRSATQTAEKTAQAVMDKLNESPATSTPSATPEPAPIHFVTAPTRPAPPPQKKSGLMGTLFGGVYGMVMPIAMKAAQNYALNYVGTMMEQMQGAAGPPPDETPAGTARPHATQSPFGR